ncbi:MAG: hypothetical protein M3Y54_02610 [Bacteroidota bacterium]|nr:hypothetical protein [Bacteroidota bacterium]
MPTLIYYDASGHQAAQRDATDIAARFTDLLSDYQTLGVPAAVTTADLPTILADPAIWLVTKWMAGGTFSLGGLPMNPNKVLELLERPAGFDSFIAKGKELAEYLGPRGQGPSPLLRAPASYAVSGGWQVALTATATAALEATFKRYTKNAKQDTLLADLTSLSTLVADLATTGALHYSAFKGQGGSQFLGGALVINSGYGVQTLTARPNPDFILQRFNN